MKNKGFTLIELLAVIVILAIIALIATPIILNMIENSRVQARQRTAELIGSEIQLAYSEYLMSESSSVSVDDFCTYVTEPYFAMDGVSQVDCENGVATIEAGETYTATYEDGTVTIDNDDNALDNPVTVKMRNATSNGGGASPTPVNPSNG